MRCTMLVTGMVLQLLLVNVNGMHIRLVHIIRAQACVEQTAEAAARSCTYN